ncbi:dihydrofolate reductase family protein [Aliikangiella sp. IMCC44359]|uniref:dihydrofolate reductase family protein n=1 Tax=Aliikangiella sp. IMCC44359 TaxID=3459125 RepID=UPI00403A8C42
MDITFSVFIASSLDGYIARPNGKLDWLEKSAIKGDTEDYGYQTFLRSVDCIVLGRNSFEKVASFSEWPYAGKRVVVLSKTLKEPPADFIDKIDVFGGSVELLAVELQHYRMSKVYVDGGLTIQSFLKFDLIDEITITQVPILIGRGIPLFGDLRDDIELELVSSHNFPSGFVQSQYRVKRRTKN